MLSVIDFLYFMALQQSLGFLAYFTIMLYNVSVCKYCGRAAMEGNLYYEKEFRSKSMALSYAGLNNFSI